MTADPNERCGVCGEPRSAHVPTDEGPLTHPREARGEGVYVQTRAPYISGGYWPGDDWEMPATYTFVPNKAGTRP